MNEPSAALKKAMRQNPVTAPRDKLEAVRDSVKQYRDLTLEVADLEARLSAKKKELDTMTKQVMPDLLEEAGVSSITIDAEGNLPPYVAKVVPYYHANIAKSWGEQQRQAAFDWLKEHNAGDIIKTIFTVRLGLGEHTKAQQVYKALKELDVEVDQEQSVPWTTLTSYIKEQVEGNKAPPLDLLGAEVGKVVKISPAK